MIKLNEHDNSKPIGSSSYVTLKMCKSYVSFQEGYGYVNLIDEQTLNNLKKQPNINRFEFFLKPYGQLEPVQTIGEFYTKCKFNGMRSKEKFVVIKGSHGNLLSYQTSIDLGIIKKVEKTKSFKKRRSLSREMYLEEFKIRANRPSRKDTDSSGKSSGNSQIENVKVSTEYCRSPMLFQDNPKCSSINIKFGISSTPLSTTHKISLMESRTSKPLSSKPQSIKVSGNVKRNNTLNNTGTDSKFNPSQDKKPKYVGKNIHKRSSSGSRERLNEVGKKMGYPVDTNEIVDKGYLSQIEEDLLRSKYPIKVRNLNEICVNGESGIWLNQNETNLWKGSIPLEEYPINNCSDPEIIYKKMSNQIEFTQEMSIKYLRPDTPPGIGDIIINQEPTIVPPPAPPMVMRLCPARPNTPEPLVLREVPPTPPVITKKKLITIPGKNLPPAPRKVVLEILPAVPSHPQNVIVERWLPYEERKRRVVFQKSSQPDPVIITPKNMIIQWEAPDVKIETRYVDLGVIRADPISYINTYGL